MDPIGKVGELGIPELCPDCNRLLTSNDWIQGDPEDLLVNRRTWPTFNKGLIRRCKLCSIVCREFNLEPNLIAEHHLILGCRIKNGDHLEKTASLELLCLNEFNRLSDDRPKKAYAHQAGGFEALRTLKFSVYTESDNPAGQSISGRLPEYEVSSDRSLQTIKQWIWHCNSHHSSCSRPEKGNLPKRLINISSLHATGTVKLQNISNERFSYVALSYCWGKSIPITTTSSNIDQHSKCIAVSSLPKSIQDAITVTCRLGFNYLWVDALCIIQDDSPEKAEEMSAMADIYSHAAVTIIAAVAKDSNQGFLHKREMIPVKALFTLPILLSDQKIGRIELCHDEEQFYKHPPEPISKRAWTLQESILSPRCLIFATQQVFWKCTKAFWKDGGFTDWPTFKENSGCGTNLGFVYTNRGLATFGGTDFVSVDCALTPGRSDLARRWAEVADAYSSRQLSVPEDKLPALSSIAALYAVLLKDDYLAGLWRFNLLAGLLWVSNIQEENRPNRICPTWSWLSVDSPVNFTYFYRPAAEWQSFAKIHTCTTTPLFDFAPYGQLKEGSLLEISGLAFTMILESTDNQGDGRCSLTSPEPFEQVLTSFVPDTKMYDCAGTRVECLILFRTTWQSWTAAGLVLSAFSLERGLYKRIGYFEAGPGSRQSWTETEKKVLQASGWIFKSPRRSFAIV